MNDNESKDVNLGLLLMFLTLSNRVEKLEKEVWKEKPAAVKTESDAIKCAKFHENNCKGWNGEDVSLRESVEKFRKEMNEDLKERETKRLDELDEKRSAEIQRLNVEIKALKAEAGVQENINKNRVIPKPTLNSRHYGFGCIPEWWR